MMILQPFIAVGALLGCLLLGSASAEVKCGSLENPPCYCEHLGGIRYNLKCFNVESKTIGDYLKAPDLSNDDLEVEFEEFAIVPFKLMASVSLEEIGENVLGNRRARVIRIATPEPYNYNVTINQDAFASSANFTQELIIYDADLSALNWDFAKNFTNLTAIHLQGIVGGIEKFSSDVPVLPSVTWLRMVRCTTTSTKYLPLASQLPSINNISLIENGITDGQIAEILNPMNGAQLEYVSLRKNELSLYPTKFTSFPTLRSVDLSENKIAVLDGNNPLQFTAPVRQVDLSNNLIRSLLNENGLFKGDFSEALINLDENELILLDGKVFFNLTQTMTSAANGGQVSLLSNNIDCEACESLAWLIRDNNYLIEDKTVVGDCTFKDGTKKLYSELTAEMYINCPATDFTTTTTTTTTTSTTRSTTTTSTTTFTTTPTASTTSTTTKPTTTTLPPEDTYQEQLAALFGLFAGLFLIVIIGFALVIYKMKKAKKAVVGTQRNKTTETAIESAPPRTQATNQELIGGYGSQQQQMTSFTQQQPPNVLPRVYVPPSTQATTTNGNPSNTANNQQPKGLRRSQYY